MYPFFLSIFCLKKLYGQASRAIDNVGGPEFKFENFNGIIYLRKKK